MLNLKLNCFEFNESCVILANVSMLYSLHSIQARAITYQTNMLDAIIHAGNLVKLSLAYLAGEI